MVSKNVIDVSVIIVNWNTKDLLKECILSIQQQTHNISYEIIVIDNFSKDESVAMVRRDFSEVQLIANDFNAGFGQANNQGYEIAKGEYLLILNPDTVILDGAIEKLYHYIKQNNHVGVCGPKCIHPDDSIQVSWASFPSIKNIFTNNVTWKEAFSMFPWFQKFSKSEAIYTNEGFTVQNVIAEQKVDYVLGQCMMTPKFLIDQVGLFNENIFMYEEEADLCYRIKKAGYETWFYPEAVIIHHERQSIDQIPNYLEKEMKWFMDARGQFFRMHYGIFAQFLFYILTFISSFLKLFIMAFLWLIEKKKRDYFKMKLLFHYYILNWFFRFKKEIP